MRTRKRRPRKHWYRLYFGECPVCGRDKSYRERVYGKRPRRRKDRIIYLNQTTTYDGCLEG
jgi:hypothetical protein